MLTERMIYLIDSKARDINKNPHKHYKYISNLIKKLEYYIDGKIKLTDLNIENILVNLLQSTVFLNIPLPKGTNIVRARKYSRDEDKLCFNNIEELSYITQAKKEIIPLGRMNRRFESKFYGCLSENDNNVGTVLSEIDISVNDIACILDSIIESEVLVRPIGLFSYFSQGDSPPWNIHPAFEEMYHYFKKVFDKKSMEAVIKCDMFFETILKKEKSDRLYNVTSLLANVCMEGDTDGIIYPSVRGDGAPNVVIKPDSIDTKVKYESVRSILVTEYLGEVLYRATVLQNFPVRVKKINRQIVSKEYPSILFNFDKI